jgi:hypothetical protein
MADFGFAGDLTIREDKSVVRLDLSKDESLFYRVVVQGAQPIFSLACRHGILWDQNDSQVQSNTYEKDWSKQPGLHVDDYHSFTMSFASADRYTLVVERRDAAGQVLEKLKDLDCSSSDPRDYYTVILNIYGDPMKRP